jgi:hypothetical protein
MDEAHFTVTNAKRNRGSIKLLKKYQIKIKCVSFNAKKAHFLHKDATKTHTLVKQS